MDNPESGKWCFFNADQKKRGPYSFSELRDRVASGKLPTGVSVVRQEDGLMLPVRHGEIRREDVEFSGAFQRYCGALERAAEQIHAPEEAVNSAFGRARESSDFLRKCAPSKLAELVNWVDARPSNAQLLQRLSRAGLDVSVFGWDEAYVRFPACGDSRCAPNYLAAR